MKKRLLRPRKMKNVFDSRTIEISDDENEVNEENVDRGAPSDNQQQEQLRQQDDEEIIRKKEEDEVFREWEEDQVVKQREKDVVVFRQTEEEEQQIEEAREEEVEARRVSDEVQADGFGKGCIISRLVVNQENAPSKSKLMVSVESMAEVSIRLAKIITEYQQVVNEVRKEFPNNETIKKLYEYGVCAFFACAQPKTQETRDDEPSSSVPYVSSSQDDEFFLNPALLKAMDELVNATLMEKKKKQKRSDDADIQFVS